MRTWHNDEGLLVTWKGTFATSCIDLSLTVAWAAEYSVHGGGSYFWMKLQDLYDMNTNLVEQIHFPEI